MTDAVDGLASNKDLVSGDVLTASLSMKEIAALSVLMLAISSIVVLSYHVIFQVDKRSFSTVDIAAIVKIREEQFTALLSRPNITDSERKEAFLLVKNTGHEIESAIDSVQKKCGCVLLVKSSVLAGEQSDKTDDVKRLLGMQVINLESGYE